MIFCRLHLGHLVRSSLIRSHNEDLVIIRGLKCLFQDSWPWVSDLFANLSLPNGMVTSACDWSSWKLFLRSEVQVGCYHRSPQSIILLIIWDTCSWCSPPAFLGCPLWCNCMEKCLYMCIRTVGSPSSMLVNLPFVYDLMYSWIPSEGDRVSVVVNHHPMISASRLMWALAIYPLCLTRETKKLPS